MKKLFLIWMITTAFQLAVMAVPVRPGQWKTVTLEDGTTVRVELRGDEYGSFWRAADGRCFVKKPGSQLFVTADMAQIQQSAMQMRMANPLPVRTLPAANANGQQRVGIGESHPAFVGSKKGLIILAEFTDKKFLPGHDVEYYTHMANDLNFSHPDGHVGSIRDYFLSQSEGQFDLTFDVVGPVQLANDMAYYGEHTDYSNDKNPAAMIKECVQAAAAQLGSFADYDWFGDSYVDQVFVIYAGIGEAEQDADPNAIWPHRSSIARTRLGGKYVQTYACANEVRLDGKVDGIGTFCHEFSHCLGLADLYDTYYGMNNNGEVFYGMGHWDVMDGGCYLGDGFRPCGYSGFEKNYCGWKTPLVLTEDTVVEALKPMSEGGDYYILYNDAHTDEYYVIENRSQTGWDAGLYGSGLLISHVDFNKNAWAYNVPNSVYPGINDHPRYTPFLADNSEKVLSSADVAGDLYPYKTNNSLTNYTLPASTLYNENPDGLFYMSKPITDITKNADGTVSFIFKSKEEEKVLPEGMFFIETFDKCNGTGGNDGKWSTSASITAPIFDNLNWYLPTGGGANQCIAMGSSSSDTPGTATTPEFTITGPCVLTFKAGIARINSSTALTVKASRNVTLEQTDFTIATKEKWNEFTTNITSPTYPITIDLTFTNGKRRTFIDDIAVGTQEAMAISSITADRPADQRIYTLDGRYAGNELNTLPAGIYILRGKKVVK